MAKQNLADMARKKRHLHLIEKLHSGKPLTKPEIAELERFEADPLGPTIVGTMEEVARVMEVTYRTVQRWKKDGMPTTSDGYYDLAQIKAWHAAKNDKGTTREFWEEKIRRYKATLLEIELKKATNELISREEVENGRVARVIAVKRAFLALPTVLAPKLAMKEPREIEAELYEAISEIIDEFSGVRDGNLESEGTTGVDATAQDNGE